MHSSRRLPVVVAILFFAAALLARAQVVQGPDLDRQRAMSGAQDYSTNGSIIDVTVRGEDHKKLTQQAIVTVTNTLDKTNYYETTNEHSEAIVTGITRGQCEIDVSAVGYITVHLSQLVGPRFTTYPFEVILKPDPSAINLDAALGAELPAKTRKEVARAVTLLKSGDLKHAEKLLLTEEQQNPNSAELDFLLGYLYMQRKQDAEATKYLEKSLASKPRDVQALAMLGKLRWQQKDFAGASKLLQQAVSLDATYWNAHYLLGDSLLRLKDYTGARDHAQQAIDKGKGAAGKAYLVLGQAEAHLGREPEAIRALQSYLQYNPSSPSIAEVRTFIEWLQQRAEDRKLDKNAASTSVYSADSVIPADDDTDEARLATRGWAPSGVDELHPQVAADAPCPVDRVMDQGSFLDYGMFIQSVMLAARAFGLDTCPQAAIAYVHDAVRAELALPAAELVICGMALGRAREDAPENRLVTEREPVAGFARFVGFDSPVRSQEAPLIPTIRITAAQMAPRISRFRDLQPLPVQRGVDVSLEARDVVYARKLMSVIGLESNGDTPINTRAPIVGAGGMTMTLAVCPPGQGPSLHAHRRTYETFTVLDGRFEVRWNDDGSDSVVLERFDTISVPPGVCRAFRNVGDREGILQVLITGGVHDMNDIDFAVAVRERLDALDPTVRPVFENLGFSFNAGPGTASA